MHRFITVRGSGVEPDWLTWLESEANRIDPIKQIKSLDFTVPRELMAQVLEMIESDPGRYAHLKELDLETSVEKAKNWISAQQNWKNG
ncbi:hypothetical protein NUW46_04445 [Marinobacter sp. MA]|uniref:hypothetical protein n=1 Tax=Marinobacter sp. MA TaxID=2971606 RepID=UPI003AAD89F9